MDAKQLVVEIAKVALGWPVAAVVIVLLLRKPLSPLLESLRLKKAKYKDLELEFGQGLRAVKKHIAATSDMPPRSLAFAQIQPILAEEEDVADFAPSGAVVVAWARLESELLRIAKEMKIEVGERPSIDRVIDALVKQGVLQAETGKAITGLRHLRNLAAHSHGEAAEISSDRARDFVAMADAVLYSIRQNLDRYLKRSP